jgi:hypothetical protein
VLIEIALQQRMDERPEHQPGSNAPATGRYEQLNVFGTPTGRLAHVREGEQLPSAPRGFTWRRAAEEGETQW